MRLSIDIGGTFTDVVLQKPDGLVSIKVLTTYDDPSRGVLDGIAQVLQRGNAHAHEVKLILHGTTLATNALIERRGAVTGLLTTAGHRDALEMAFENRFEQYDVNIDRPTPLVPRNLRMGIPQRHAADGEELVVLDEPAIHSAIGELLDQGVESLAVGFLHSYIAPQHEQRVGTILAADYPQLSVTLSSDVCPEIREYERLSTTTANAYVKPLMQSYLVSLADRLDSAGFSAQVLMMTSGGGLTTLEAAARYPIRLVESGPAGGAILAASIAKRLGLERVLSFDMGGTTAKICLIDDSLPQHSRSFEVDRSYRFKKGSGLPVRIPVIEMVEIGAGGGSIARVDALQRVQVGPDSASSKPGPACYGRGGDQATVTDADTTLGRLTPELFAGGAMKLDVQAAERVLVDRIGGPLNLDAHDAAFAVSEIVEENMASAARAHASEWGKEVQGRCLIAFGGAAPLHALSLARKLKIDRVLIPAGAGVGSAIGFLLAPVRFEVVRSHYMQLQDLDVSVVDDLFGAMRNEARAVIDGAGVSAPSEHRQAFMRYIGQGYEVAVDLPSSAISTAELRQGFEKAYQGLYGRTIPGMDVEILSWTLALGGDAPDDSWLESASNDSAETSRGKTRIYESGELVAADVFDRTAVTDVPRPGPALVVEAQTTTVVPSTGMLSVLPDGTLDIRLED